MREGIIADERSSKTADNGALTLDEFCRRYRVGRTTAYEEINAGRLTARKRGSRTLIARDEARRWFRSLPPIELPIPIGTQRENALSLRLRAPNHSRSAKRDTSASEQRHSDAANAQEFHEIQQFVAACRRQWPGAVIVLRPNQDGPPAGASAPPNSETGTRS